MNRIVILIPYFGRWPEWMRFTLESCRWNPTINWVLITDHPLPATPPSNVKIIQTAWDEYLSLVERQLKITFRPDSAYKLCDLKPAIAAIHPEYVEGYDFFGFGDIDVVYGNLRKYFTEDLLRHDLISTHSTGISGHLCLIRNKPRLVNAFRHAKEWRSILQDPKHLRFDEGRFRKLFYIGHGQPDWYRKIRIMLSAYARKALFKEFYSTPYGYNDDSNLPSKRPPERWLWRTGTLVDAQNEQHEYMYLHFMNWKSNRYLHINGKPGVAAWSKLDRVDHVDDHNLSCEWTIGWDGFRNIHGASNL